MKFALFVLFAVLGAANASLNDDIQEFIQLIPVAEIRAVTAEYAANDDEFRIAVAYLQSAEFHSILGAIHDTPEWQEFVEYLAAAGVDVYKAIDGVNSLLNVNSYNNVRASPRVLLRSFHGWMDTVLGLIPTSELVALAQYKLQTSSDFQELAAQLKSDDFQAVVNAVASNAEWQALVQKGRDHGAPVDVWIALIHNLFGWQ